ncbi:MAG TPA: hypothetical protein VL443_12635 [Cyclobacteriaceae bacterium]|nr:hypothetical protein [Cyclobacteriaceae bacterium]
MRVAVVIFILVGVLSAIVGLFWYQEIQYLLPTPIPQDYRVVLPGDVIKYDSILIPQQYSKPKLFHFFNPDCPCSRFNIKHFQSLQKSYSDKVDFFVVVTSQEKVAGAEKLIDKDITIVVDASETLAKACGVYSTPQAALIQSTNQLYFRGNYNRSRYCTDQNSNFVQMALDSLISFRKPPHFNELATHSYGCSIPQKENTIGNL